MYSLQAHEQDWMAPRGGLAPRRRRHRRTRSWLKRSHDEAARRAGGSAHPLPAQNRATMMVAQGGPDVW